MTPIILFRKDYLTEEEYNISKLYFKTVENRVKIDGKLVVGRYSVLPFYKELESDLYYNSSKLINSLNQHLWIADFEYYEQLKDFTFETWDEKQFPYSNYDGPMVVKGKTNSKKDRWKTHMFAKNKKEAIETASRIYEDSHYGTQELIYRKYEPLKSFENGLSGIPFSNEWRFFYYQNKLLSHGFYWSIAENSEKYQINEKGLKFAQNIAEISKDYCNFFVIDIAERINGEWILVELNDGQMSGLSLNDPHILYKNLFKELHDNNH